MLKNIFLKTLRDNRKSLLFWAIGMVTLSLYVTLFYPTVKNMPGMADFIKNSPKQSVITAIYGGAIPDFTTPDGYLNMYLFSLMLPILFIVFTIGFGSSAIAGEEEKGTMDFLLANPIPRRRVVIQKLCVMVVELLFLSVVFYIALAIGAMTVKIDINYLNLAEATFSSVLLALVFGSLGLFIGSLRGNRGLALGATGALAVAMYFLNSLGDLSPALKNIRYISPFYHNINPNTLVNGLSIGHMLVLLVLVIIFSALSVPTFERRDISV